MVKKAQASASKSRQVKAEKAKEVTCESCNGRGLENPSTLCPDCEGSGKIKK